jgi:hypothetical protein
MKCPARNGCSAGIGVERRRLRWFLAALARHDEWSVLTYRSTLAVAETIVDRDQARVIDPRWRFRLQSG